MTLHAVAADTVFDGDTVHRDVGVIIEDDRILRLMPAGELPTSLPVKRMPKHAWLAPGFIDVQVNGGGDVLFNDSPTPDGIAAIVAAHRRFGTTALLPTLITDTADKMQAARKAVDMAMEREPGVLGIHFEGPFLSPDRRGVHDPALIRAPDDADRRFLTRPAPGITVVTLAPERVPAGFVAALAKAGLRVCLGHSAASYDETRTALADGLAGFTHLFNAMPAMLARAPGPAAAALEAAGAWYGLIVDGAHVAPAMLRLALRSVGRPMLVTDAMPPVGGSGKGFRLYGEEIALAEGRCVRADGTLAGSALEMASAVRNCVRLLGIGLPEALRLASTEPAAFLGIDGRLGRLRSGYRADLVALEPEPVRVLGTWVAGREYEVAA